ncbi:hypothetical protein CDD81_2879 [Ophiocordyceps australis]|uniref:Tse2 ADP-ribosyltransferase toxin domain-containing protein n=1 Tax=Ophiocordyceps australis TaxID=1399860 RepID=A0A2C5XEC4_9HYPO|nr:hypothetical protein CDD81_2879 [Ophiocordyceps australis]
MLGLRRQLGRAPVSCCHYFQRRAYKATYHVFPTTLHTLKHRPGVFFPEDDGGTGYKGGTGPLGPGIFDGGVTVADDGYVYPQDMSQCDDPIKDEISEEIISNGLVMLPNTYMMQASVAEKHMDSMPTDLTGGMILPRVYTIPKGTRVPRPLVLANVVQSLFSLQPDDDGMSFREFRQVLHQLFEQHSTNASLDAWLRMYRAENAPEDGYWKL